VVTWVLALTVWRLGGIEEKWDAQLIRVSVDRED
jgi:hypothetical protein